MKKWIPWIVVIVAAGWLLGTLRQAPETGFHTRDFGKIPVLLNGRIQPFDSMARNSLLQMRARQSVDDVTADEWLVELLMKPDAADKRPVFRIDNLELLNMLSLQEKQKYYSLNDIQPHLTQIATEAQRIDKIESANRSVFEQQLMKLYNAADIYQRLKLTLAPAGSKNLALELAEYEKLIPAGITAVRAREAKKTYDEPTLNEFLGYLAQFDDMSQFAYPLVVPPLQDAKSRDDWQNIGTSLMNLSKGGDMNPAVKDYTAMVTAYQNNQPDNFNQALDDYRQWVGQWYSTEAGKGIHEAFYNYFQAFYKAIILYVLAFLLAVIALLTFAIAPKTSETLRRTAFYLVILTGLIHTFAIVFRMVLEGRPPVTNLYSSAIFIGWGCVGLGLILERVFRVGLGCAVASFAGFVTLVIAQNLAIDGDTMEMMRAVLDTNFWLATHVVVVTLGYASTFMSGFLAITYILLGLFTPLLSQKVGQLELGKVLTKMVYGIVCFATLFSFTGTVLGGIWADQSWGRFWGWDPKENGALLIVIWNAIILHCRWGGLVRDRGIMNLAVFGNIVTSFSWFGVNMLGIGLHSYGFMQAAFNWLVLFIGTQVTIIILGLLPSRFWRSFQTKQSLADDKKLSPEGAANALRAAKPLPPG
jgi:ABC-type transport system involved in cytochrome c biogenesis permease subunit